MTCCLRNNIAFLLESSRFEFDKHLREVVLNEMSHRQIVRVRILLLVNELEVKVLAEVCRCDFDVRFSKCLAEANALAAVERDPG